MQTHTPPQFETVDVPIGPEETLRLGLEWDSRGQPIYLHLALGVGAGRQWRETTTGAPGLAVPHERLGEFVRALLPLLNPHRR